jgi:hypothetical protein
MRAPNWPADLYKGTLLPFETETEAVDYISAVLRPFCHTIKPEPEFSNGLRADLGIRLNALPEIPIVLEVKKFTHGNISPLPAAIAQASSYADLTGYAAFVAPLSGSSVTKFCWTMGFVGPALLVAGQFNVGALYFFGDSKRPWRAGFILSGIQVACLSYLPSGEANTTLHYQAAHLLKAKKRSGSSARRS